MPKILEGIESLPQTIVFIIPIPLQPNFVELRYFKPYVLLDQIIHHQVKKKNLALENLSLWQRLNSFVINLFQEMFRNISVLTIN